MRRLVIALSVVALVLGIVSFAGATPVDFKIGENNSIVGEGVSLNYTTDDNLENLEFTLDDNGSYGPFNYALVAGISGNGGRQNNEYNVTAYLDFDLPHDIRIPNPVANNGTLTITRTDGCSGGGSTGGKKGNSNNNHNNNNNNNSCTKKGNVSLSFDPVEVPFGDDGWFIVQLTGFDVGWQGTCCSPANWQGTITATVTLEKAPAPVPEPSTLLLLGGGILGAAAFLRRRRRN